MCDNSHFTAISLLVLMDNAFANVSVTKDFATLVRDPRDANMLCHHYTNKLELRECQNVFMAVILTRKWSLLRKEIDTLVETKKH